MMKWYTTALLLIILQQATARELRSLLQDSLQDKPYSYFEQRILATDDTNKRLSYAKK